MSLSSSKVSNARTRLVGLSKELLAAWHEVQPSWRDRRARQFNRDTLQPLFDSVDRAAESLEELDALLQRLRKDCGDE